VGRELGCELGPGWAGGVGPAGRPGAEPGAGLRMVCAPEGTEGSEWERWGWWKAEWRWAGRGGSGRSCVEGVVP